MPPGALSTGRLVLLRLTASLAADCLAGSGPAPPDPKFPRPDDLLVLEDAAGAVDAAAHRYVVATVGPGARRLVGTVGVVGRPTADGEQEIGYGLVPSARGQGLGAEAVAALCAVLARDPGVRWVTAQVQADNAPSRRLLERLGFRSVPGAAAGHLLLRRATRAQRLRTVPRHEAMTVSGRHVC